jgi:hypothetical protein
MDLSLTGLLKDSNGHIRLSPESYKRNLRKTVQERYGPK